MKNNLKMPKTVGGSTEVGPTGSTNVATGTSWVWSLQSSLHVIDTEMILVSIWYIHVPVSIVMLAHVDSNVCTRQPHSCPL